MELRQLRYFLAVADHRSFVSAANKLYISRQAVSKAISQLEEELGVELFMRDTSGAFLSPAGIVFYDRVRGPVMELTQVQNDMQEYGAQYHQMIRIAFSVGTLCLFEQKLQEYMRVQNNVVIEYRECGPRTCEELLKSREIDMAISISPFTDHQFYTGEVYRTSLGVLLEDGDSSEGLDRLEVNDLHWVPVACLKDGQCDVLCQKNKLKPQYLGMDILRLIDLARSGRCSALLPRELVPDYITGVRYVPLEGDPEWTVQYAHLESLDKNPLLQMTLDELLQKVFLS